jgi:hypothetical protein
VELAKFEVPTTMLLKIPVFWIVALYRLINNAFFFMVKQYLIVKMKVLKFSEIS